MSEIKSVEEAACEYAPFSKGMANNNISFQTERRFAFIDGAKWQKEQDKELAEAAEELLKCDYTSGTHLYSAQQRLLKALQQYFELKNNL